MDELVFPREFTRVARWAGGRTAFVDHVEGETTSFSEHHDRVARLCGALRERLGLRPGDRFAALADNRSTYAEFWHAGLCGAGVLASLNPRAGREDLWHTLRDAGARVLVTGAAHAETVDSLRGALPDLETVVLVGDEDVPHDVTYRELVDGADARMPDPPGEDDPCLLVYTGGTTGTSRGVVHDQRALMLAWYRSIEAMRPAPDWSCLQAVPMFHVGALMPLLKVHLAGARVEILPRWDPGQALDVIERHRLVALAAVPTMIAHLLAHPDFAPERIASLRSVTYGASPMPTELLRRLLAVLPEQCRLIQTYGMTETCGAVTVLDDADHRGTDTALLSSAGRPLAGVELSVRGAAGAALPPGEAGEIWVRCRSTLREYLGRPAETAAVLTEGWFHTGDVGRLDERGYLWIVDRMKDMIVTGGENVYSVEVENAISTMTGVARVAVIGVDHPSWGEAVHAVVQPEQGVDLSPEGVLAHAAMLLSRHKLPKSVDIRDEPLPLSPAGKVLKRVLRDEWRTTVA